MSGVIELRGLGKRYWKLEERAKLSQAVMPFVKPHREELWALRNIDLEVSAGETVGVLGHNGAGKTTLLRLLAGVTRPSEGHLRVVGRIAPLISLGVGFHQEMSGRENVLVNGMLLGLSAQQVAERFDSIVEFAELEEFIDTPVKFYSSGMFMRLGFSVVIHVDPTILLVDEILAVGDAAFQLKCFDRLSELRQQGAAIVVVSHSLHTIRQLCRRAVLISHGQLLYDGDAERAIAMHYEAMSSGDAEHQHERAIEIRTRRLLGEMGESHHANYDEPMALALGLHFNEAVSNLELTFTIHTDTGYPVMAQNARIELDGGNGFATGAAAQLRLSFRARLGGGNYMLEVAIRSEDGRLLGRSEGLMLFVAGRPSSVGVVELNAEFAVDGVDRTDRRTMILEA